MPRTSDDRKVSDVVEFLKDYNKFDEDSRKLPLGSKVAYFSFDRDSGVAQFRKGGYISINDAKSDTIGIANGAMQWFVNRNVAKFWIHIEPALTDAESKKFNSQIKKLMKIAKKAEDKSAKK